MTWVVQKQGRYAGKPGILRSEYPRIGEKVRISFPDDHCVEVKRASLRLATTDEVVVAMGLTENELTSSPELLDADRARVFFHVLWRARIDKGSYSIFRNAPAERVIRSASFSQNVTLTDAEVAYTSRKLSEKVRR